MFLNKEKFDVALAVKKLTLDELSQKAGITKQTICRIRRGDSLIPKTVGKLAEALEVDVEFLVKGE